MLPRVLIVDDESSICISLSLALESDYDMAWETDHIKALERIQQESFDLILLDMVIGEYNGLDILVKMRSISPPHSGNNDDRLRQHSLLRQRHDTGCFHLSHEATRYR